MAPQVEALPGTQEALGSPESQSMLQQILLWHRNSRKGLNMSRGCWEGNLRGAMRVIEGGLITTQYMHVGNSWVVNKKMAI